MPIKAINIPAALLDKLNQHQGDNFSAKVCELLAQSLSVDYSPSKRGGRRVPRNLTAAEVSRAQVTPEQSFTMPAILTVKEKRFTRDVSASEGASRTMPLKSTGAQHAAPVNSQSTLAGQGYPYAEIFKANNRYTGKLAKSPDNPRPNCRYENVGHMTLADFEKACGRPATME